MVRGISRPVSYQADEEDVIRIYQSHVLQEETHMITLAVLREALSRSFTDQVLATYADRRLSHRMGKTDVDTTGRITLTPRSCFLLSMTRMLNLISFRHNSLVES